ncbi:hypothetical protein F4V57_03155 [Acinetobacter qingfengensis]|uniref:Uncharacterized protein n=1 Tax=Acinetobacter qingfengensis TaxID=1262585 RepID=A0A1E7REH2_9GAMM|nr:hypothetical protein [Acinetobacter qingfengensis]KAA8734774.1 hypothetical protein F4V57_03155 [Acinetobacter qingfengensis]OEY97693.1 hypothetical protein BJI46_08765 [Acinetobacter qingfengensis]
MKKQNILSLFALSIILSACQKPDEQQPQQQNTSASTAYHSTVETINGVATQAADNKQTTPSTISNQQQFNQADQKISAFMDQIEDSNTSQNLRHQIICQDYPNLYTQQYIPALLKLSPKNTDQKSLLEQMNFILNDYKQRYNIKCSSVK